MALRALRSNRLKVGISQHEPFAAGLFKLNLHPGVLALAFDHDHGAKAKLFMVYGGAKAQRRGRAAVGLADMGDIGVGFFDGAGAKPRAGAHVFHEIFGNL